MTGFRAKRSGLKSGQGKLANLDALDQKHTVYSRYFFTPFLGSTLWLIIQRRWLGMATDISVSPLFARQYERRKKGKGVAWVGDEYHRIHPLTKAGLDLSHFCWVRWNMNGDVSFVETVDPQYHGQNYWTVKELKSDKKRASREVY